jgi:hypothetical protein
MAQYIDPKEHMYPVYPIKKKHLEYPQSWSYQNWTENVMMMFTFFSLNPLENSKDSRPPRCLACLAVARLTICGACRARGRNWGHVVEDLWFLMVEQNSIHSLFTGQQNITNG